MIRSAVTFSMVKESIGGPFVFRDDLNQACVIAKSLGFDAMELFYPDSSSFVERHVKEILADFGLAAAAVGTGAGWLRGRLTLTSADAGVRGNAIQFVQFMIDAGNLVKAPAIIGSMQGRWGDGTDRATALGYLRDSLVKLGEHAKQYGQPLLYEPLNRYETNLLTTLAEAVEFIKPIPNVLLLADAFHMNIEEADPTAAIRAAGKYIGHYHFADSNRRAAGMGHTDFASQAAALKAAGYQGFVSAECLPLPDPEAAAKQTIDSFNRFFRS